jgi:hypothetical protein
VCVFYADRKSKMATTAGHSIIDANVDRNTVILARKS